MAVELAVGKATGTPRYLIFEDNQNGYTEPYIMNLPDMLEEVISFDAAKIFLITTDHQVVPVHVESTDGDPDYFDWEVTLLEDGGELVERIEFDPDDPNDVASANREICVNGFV